MLNSHNYLIIALLLLFFVNPQAYAQINLPEKPIFLYPLSPINLTPRSGIQAFVRVDHKINNPSFSDKKHISSTKNESRYITNEKYSYNPTRKPIYIYTSSLGRYQVRFEGIADPGGNVIVQAYDADNARCQIVKWHSDTADLHITVGCFDLKGNPTAARFMVWYVNGGTPVSGGTELAYLWSHSSNTSYTPEKAYQYSSAGGIHTVTRKGLGRYSVILANHATEGGTVSVSAYGTTPSFCNIAGWSKVDANMKVEVYCFDGRGAAADSRFSLRFMKALSSATTDLQYIWANDPTASRYQPSTAYRYNTSTNRNISINRIALGSYEVTLPDTVAVKSTIAVTAYTNKSITCQSHGWNASSNDTIISVRCIDAENHPIDSRFTLAYQNGNYPYRVMTQSLRYKTPTTVNLARWDGYVQVDNSFGNNMIMVPITMKHLGFEITDSWFRSTDGSLSKSLVDRDRIHRGVFTLRADGSNYTAIDLNADGIADIVEMVGADLIRRILVTEPLGRNTLDEWLRNGTNPFCRGTGPDVAVPDDLTRGRMLGCPGQNYKNLISALSSVNPIYNTTTVESSVGIIDNLLCSEFRATRPSLFEKNITQKDGGWFDTPITELAGVAAREFLNNGFDGVRDSGAERAVRTILAGPAIGVGLLLTFEAEAFVALSKVVSAVNSVTEPSTYMEAAQRESQRILDGGSGPTTTAPDSGPSPNGDDSNDSETEGTTTGDVDTTGGVCEYPLPDDTTSAILEESCKSRSEGGPYAERNRIFKEALSPKCTDPAESSLGGSATCVGIDEIEQISADEALRTGPSCTGSNDSSTNTCIEPAGLNATLIRFRYNAVGLKGLETCNPIVCRPSGN